MTNAKTVWVIAVLLSLTSSPVLSVVQFKDGQIHDINYEIKDNVWVDYESPGMQTQVNLLPGGVITDYYDLRAYSDSHVNILGGWIGNNLRACDNSLVQIFSGFIGRNLIVVDNSRADISGGSMDLLWAAGNSYIEISSGSINFDLQAINKSRVYISGGSIGTEVFVYENSQVQISGGSIGGALIPNNWSILTIQGSDFTVDGQPFGYGELMSIYGGTWQLESTRHLTGTLVSGEMIDNYFFIGYDASIVLVPEPAMILLLALGGLAVIRRRRA